LTKLKTVLDIVPVKPVLGVTLHSIEAIVPSVSATTLDIAVLEPVTAVVGAVIVAVGGILAAV